MQSAQILVHRRLHRLRIHCRSVESSVCHKKGVYEDVMGRDVMASRWWETNEGVLTCGDCVKKHN